MILLRQLMSRMQFVSFQYFIILAFICGDKCLQYGKEYHRSWCENNMGYLWESAKCQWNSRKFQGASKKICQCGQQTMSINEFKSYCCSPDWPCQDQGNKIVCKNGTLVNMNDKCGNECPTAEFVSAMAIATKGACDQEGKCFINENTAYDVNEVCDHSQKNGSDFAEKFCGIGRSVPCLNNVTNGMHNKVGQCYNTGYIG